MQSLILTLDAAGVPHRWSTWQDAAVSLTKGLVLWSLGHETVHYGGTSRLTGAPSSLAIPTIMALRGRAKVGRRIPPLTNRNLFLRDRHQCAYCGQRYPAHKLSRDHIVPTSRGGRNIWSNCTTACVQCNNRKDDRLLTECGMELLYVPYVPDMAESLLMANRRILADQHDFLLNMLPAHSRLLH